MKTVRNAIHGVVGGMCLASMQPAVAAEVQPGFYLGVGAGESSFDIEKAEFDSAVRTALASQGAFVISNASTLEDSDTSLALFAGYRFNPYIAVEGGYIDLGTAEYRWTGIVNPPGPVTSAPTSMNIDVESNGFTIAGLGSLPIGEIFELHGRLGVLFASTDLTVSGRFSNSSASQTESLDSIGAFFALGAGLNLGQHWSLSLDWTRYDNVGDEDEDDDPTTEAGFDIDALSFSAMFRF